MNTGNQQRKKGREMNTSQLIEVWSPKDAFEAIEELRETATATILDPWYNKGAGGTMPDYDIWLDKLVHAAAKKSQHVLVFGFPEIVHTVLNNLPPGFKLVSWLTWYYKNCPSVIRGWRSAQEAILHLSTEDAKLCPEHFLNDAQLELKRKKKLRYMPGPPSVIEVPLNIGFVGRAEQFGHPGQKPLRVIKQLLLMATKVGDLVFDPMCGTGTTAVVCHQLERRAIVCDESDHWIQVTRDRLATEMMEDRRAGDLLESA